jgi:death-on-curing protein
MAVRYLDFDSVLRIVQSAGLGPVRDAGLVLSSLGRPQATVFGQDAYPSLCLKAAALLQSLAGNDALVDGNKRLAWTAAVVFLDINGHDTGLNEDEAYDLMLEVAGGLSDVEVIAERLKVRPS